MTSNTLDDVQDVDYQNVLQSVVQVEKSAALPMKQRRGQRSNKGGLEESRKALSDDVQKLLTSPHAKVVSPSPALSREATIALRSLYDLIQIMIKAGDRARRFDKELKELVHRAVTALNPEHTFKEDESNDEDKKGKRKAIRKSERIAGLLEQKYTEEESSDNDMAELIDFYKEDDGDKDEEGRDENSEGSRVEDDEQED